jgi:hypothetical protein
MLKLLNGLQKDMGLLLSPVVLVEDQGMFVFYLGMLSAILFKMCNLLRSSFTSVSGVIGQYAKCQDKFDSEQAKQSTLRFEEESLQLDLSLTE